MLVTDRLRSLRLGDQFVEQVGLPYHWGRNGITTGRLAQRPGQRDDGPQRLHPGQGRHLRHPAGRRPRGPALTAYVEDYRRRAGVDMDDPTDGGRD